MGSLSPESQYSFFQPGGQGVQCPAFRSGIHHLVPATTVHGWEGLSDSGLYLSCCHTSPSTSDQSSLCRRLTHGAHLSLQGFEDLD